MVEYPIQVRWPYEPPLARAMRSQDWIIWFSYQVLFLGTSADFIRTYFAFERFSAK
jgi:hypothetical protein